MHTVTILGYEQAYASAITGALDLFSLAGVTWQRMQNVRATPLFNVQLASRGCTPIQCINGITLKSQVAIEDVSHTDLLLIPTIGGEVNKVINENRGLLKHIRAHFHAGADIASNCSGAFFLAEAGVLDGRQATTHWGYADLFRQQYPKVQLQAEKMITQDDTLFCAGGGMAWFDLALLLIERYCGHQEAANVAKAHVLDLARGTQAAYAQVHRKKYHQDADVLAMQEYLERHFAKHISLQALPHHFNMSPRTCLRRFKQATSQTPRAYLQTVRIEAAKKLLESSTLSPEQVVTKVGYEDLSSFTRLFKQHTGLSPSQYRKKFKR